MKYSLAIILFFTCMSSHAALNKWVDADGKVHYSDAPPADAQVKTLKSARVPETSSPASGVYTQKTVAEQEAEWKKTQKSKEEAEKKANYEKEVAAVKQKNCEGARSNLSTLENSPSIVTYNAKGERVYMDDATRKQKAEDARKAVSSYCN